MPPKNDTMVKPTKNVSKSVSKYPKNSSGKKNVSVSDPHSLVIEMAELAYQNGGTLTYDDVLKFGEE